jgi:ABC-type branched-subunit amino acid transport system substrate-binding protein
MRSKKSRIVFLNVSFVGADALGNILANKGIGVIVSQVTPFPYYVKVPVVHEYKSLLNRMMPDESPSYISMEGYIAAKTLSTILMGTPKLTRADFIANAEKQTALDLGGFVVSFSPTSHQGSNMVNLTQIGPGGYPERIESLRKIRDY